jgi:UDP-N-acetylmuramoylalanine--D-glutamate ligase
MSAHQLQNIEFSPHTAVLLNVFPEHLDHFDSFKVYQYAKMNIARFQVPGDKLIIAEDLSGSDISNFHGEKIAISKKLVDNLTEKLDFSRITLKGKHNRFNIATAISTVQLFNIDNKKLIDSVYSFESLPHRLEYVGNFSGIYFYNDSISTVPESTMAAVETISGIKSLILGGFDRGLDYNKLVAYLKKTSIRNFIFSGKAGEEMLALFKIRPNPDQQLFKVNSMEEAFKIIVEQTPEGSACLLSPAAASYDQFHNFEHRGTHFKNLAVSIKKGG